MLIPIALLLEWEGLAEELAVFVYYLLIFTVLVELKNYFIGERKKVNIKNFIYVKNKSISVEQKLLKTDSFGGVWIKKSWSFANKYFLEIINYISRVRVSKFFIWYGVVGLINLIIPLLVFNFRGLPYFRDLVSLPYFHNLNSLRLDLEFVENSLFNSLVRSRFDPVFLSEGYFILWFF
ncbi:hypothetical protein HC766_06170 [Candidatus Gracilibacteria bacterium]|nr:hypothetical protein [Candidatus Gracilibacteria bacterium]